MEVFGALAQSRLHSLGFAFAGADEGVRPYTAPAEFRRCAMIRSDLIPDCYRRFAHSIHLM